MTGRIRDVETANANVDRGVFNVPPVSLELAP